MKGFVRTVSLVAAVLYATSSIAQTTISPPANVGGNTPSSSDPTLVLTNPVTNATGSGSSHGFVDNRSIDRSGNIGDNSLDIRPEVTGSNNYDHFAGIQCRQKIGTTGTTGSVQCLIIAPEYWDGAVSGQDDIVINGPAVHSGSVGPHRGVFCPANAHASSYCIWSDMPVRINAKLDVRAYGEIARFSTPAPSSADRCIVIGAQDLTTEGFKLCYNGSTANSTFESIGGSVIVKGTTGVQMFGMPWATSGSRPLCLNGNVVTVSSTSNCPP